eukprot:gene11570-13503_t
MLEAAQTHVIPKEGLSWSTPIRNTTLHLVGNRQTMLLVDFAPGTLPIVPYLTFYINGIDYVQTLGTIILTAPLLTPLTESLGAKYSTTAWSCNVPAAWVLPGLVIKATSTLYSPSSLHHINVGMSPHLDIKTLPFYVFGCTPSNCGIGLAVTTVPWLSVQQELYQKWPVSTLNFVNHPAGYVQLPYLILNPEGPNKPAIRITNKGQSRDTYATLGVFLTLLAGIRSANGEAPLNSQHYGPVLMANALGNYEPPAAGLGTIGGSTSVGDDEWASLFLHEKGHSFGLLHSGEVYPNYYPYPSGSLKGSAWGFDFNHNEFLSPFMPTTAYRYPNCQLYFLKDAQGRCIKKSIMADAGADGFQSTGYRYTMFADYEAGVMQQYFEGSTTLSPTDEHVYNGGRLVADTSFPSGYKRWDTIDKVYVGATVTNDTNGLWGMDNGLPYIRNVPVATIMLTYSSAGTPNVNQIYPLLKYTGNLRRWIDPTDAAQRAIIVPNTGALPWYCHNTGCDYTLRVTYADNSKIHILIQQGIRAWFDPSGIVPDYMSDPYHGASLKTIIQNVPATKTITLVELLFTSFGYNGFTFSPNVLRGAHKKQRDETLDISVFTDYTTIYYTTPFVEH